METEEYMDARMEIRLTWGMKDEIEREAIRLRCTSSELLRALFEQHVERRDRGNVGRGR